MHNNLTKVDDQEPILSILIVGRIYEEDETFKITRQAIKQFKELIRCQFYLMDKNTLSKVQLIFKDIVGKIFKASEHASKIDYVVTIGGDGTILFAAKQFIEEKETPPFIAFQKGTLGFMCKFQTEKLQQLITRAVLLKRNQRSPIKYPLSEPLFNINKTMRLRVQITEKGQQFPNVTKICVNQVAVTREHSEKIMLGIYWNKQLLTETSGDGILVSTPTGSTAYALSAGGPIISNGVNCIQIVPIAPNSLSFRPICIPSSSEISVQISQKSKSNAYLSFDGQSSYLLKKGDWMTIKQSKSDLVFLEPTDKQQTELPDWMQRLQQFLGWNEGFKSPKCDQLQKRLPKISQRTNSLHGIQLEFGKRKLHDSKSSQSLQKSQKQKEGKSSKKNNVKSSFFQSV